MASRDEGVYQAYSTEDAAQSRREMTRKAKQKNKGEKKKMNEVAKRETPSAIIARMEGQFAKVLPKVLPPDRFCRVVLTAINKNQTLADALADHRNQASVLSAFMRCAEMGLEPDGRRAAITCYKKSSGGYDVTLVPMYQGLAELAMRSGMISNIHADKVCENDTFDWNTGEIQHKIDFRKPRGKVYAYYCIVRFKDGSVKTETMSLEEVNAIRDRSSGYQYAKKYGKSCPWTTDPEEMGKKTVFRRCSKWLPLSPEQREVFEADDDDYLEPAAAIRHAADDKFAQANNVGENAVIVDAEAGDSIPMDTPAADQTDAPREERDNNLFGNDK